MTGVNKSGSGVPQPTTPPSQTPLTPQMGRAKKSEPGTSTSRQPSPNRGRDVQNVMKLKPGQILKEDAEKGTVVIVSGEKKTIETSRRLPDPTQKNIPDMQTKKVTNTVLNRPPLSQIPAAQAGVTSPRPDLSPRPGRQAPPTPLAKTPSHPHIASPRQATEPKPSPSVTTPRNPTPTPGSGSGFRGAKPSKPTEPSDQAHKGFAMGMMRLEQNPKPGPVSAPNLPTSGSKLPPSHPTTTTTTSTTTTSRQLPSPAGKTPASPRPGGQVSAPSLSTQAGKGDTVEKKVPPPVPSTPAPPPRQGTPQRQRAAAPQGVPVQATPPPQPQAASAKRTSIPDKAHAKPSPARGIEIHEEPVSRDSQSRDSQKIVANWSTKLQMASANVEKLLVASGDHKSKSTQLKSPLETLEKTIQEFDSNSRDSEHLKLLLDQKDTHGGADALLKAYERAKKDYLSGTVLLFNEKLSQIKPGEPTTGIKTARLLSELITKDQKNTFGVLAWLVNTKMPGMKTENPEVFNSLRGLSPDSLQKDKELTDSTSVFLLVEALKNAETIKEADTLATQWNAQIDAMMTTPNQAEKFQILDTLTRVFVGTEELEWKDKIDDTMLVYLKDNFLPKLDSVKQFQQRIISDILPLHADYMKTSPLVSWNEQLKTITTSAKKAGYIDEKEVENLSNALNETFAFSANEFKSLIDKFSKEKNPTKEMHNKLSKFSDLAREKLAPKPPEPPELYKQWVRDLGEVLKPKAELTDRLNRLSSIFPTDEPLISTILNEIKKDGVLSKQSAANLKAQKDKLLGNEFLKADKETANRLNAFFDKAINASNALDKQTIIKIKTLINEMNGNTPDQVPHIFSAKAEHLLNKLNAAETDVAVKNALNDLIRSKEFTTLSENNIAEAKKMTDGSKLLTQLRLEGALSTDYSAVYNTLLDTYRTFTSKTSYLSTVGEVISTEATYKTTMQDLQETLNLFIKNKTNDKEIIPPKLQEHADLINQSTATMEKFHAKIDRVKGLSDKDKINATLEAYDTAEFQQYVEAIAQLTYNKETLDVDAVDAKDKTLTHKNKTLNDYYIETKDQQGIGAATITPVQRVLRHRMFLETLKKMTTGETFKKAEKAEQTVLQAGSYLNKMQIVRDLSNATVEMETKDLSKSFKETFNTLINKDNLNLAENQYKSLLNKLRLPYAQRDSTVKQYKIVLEEAKADLQRKHGNNAEKSELLNSVKKQLDEEIRLLGAQSESTLLAKVPPLGSKVTQAATAEKPSASPSGNLQAHVQQFSDTPVTMATFESRKAQWLALLTEMAAMKLPADQYDALMTKLVTAFKNLEPIEYDQLVEEQVKNNSALLKEARATNNTAKITNLEYLHQALLLQLNKTQPVMQQQPSKPTSTTAPSPQPTATTPKTGRREQPAIPPKSGSTIQKPAPTTTSAPAPAPTATTPKFGRKAAENPPVSTEPGRGREATPSKSRPLPQVKTPEPASGARAKTPQPQRPLPEPQQPDSKPEPGSTRPPPSRFKPPWMK